MTTDPDIRTARPARRLLGLTVRVAVTALLLVWLFRHAGGLSPVLGAVRAARLPSIAVAFFANLAVQVAIAHRPRDDQPARCAGTEKARPASAGVS